MESSTQDREQLSHHRALPDHLSRSSSLNPVAPRRASGYFTAFYNSLSRNREPDQAQVSRRASTRVTPAVRDPDRNRAPRRASTFISPKDDTNSYLQSFEDESANMPPLTTTKEESDSADGRTPIPPVPDMAPEYVQKQPHSFRRPLQTGAAPPGALHSQNPFGFQNGGVVHPGRMSSVSTVAGSASSQNMGPVSYQADKRGADPFRIGNTTHPDPLRSNPTVAATAITASASANDLSRPTRDAARVASSSRIPPPVTRRIPRPGLSDATNRGSMMFEPSRMQHSRTVPNFQPPKQENIPIAQNLGTVSHADLFAAIDITEKRKKEIAAEQAEVDQAASGSSQPIIKPKRSILSMRKTSEVLSTKSKSGRVSREGLDTQTSSTDGGMASQTSFPQYDHPPSELPGSTPSSGGIKKKKSFFGLGRRTSSNETPVMPSSSLTSETQDNYLTSLPRKFSSTMNLGDNSPSSVPGPITGRNVSEPVMPSQTQENSHGLKERTSPAHRQGQAKLTRSGTSNMLYNLKASLSRSRVNLGDDSSVTLASYGGTAEPTTQVSNASATAERPGSVTNLEDVSVAMGAGYWGGRLSSLCDRYQNEMLREIMSNQATLDRYSDTNPAYDFRARETDPQRAAEREEYEPATAGMNLLIMDVDARHFKAFEHLQATCKTDEAAKDFWEFQQNYARAMGKSEYLPVGGDMKEQPRQGMVKRMVRNMTGGKSGGASGTQTAGRRTGLASVFGKSGQK